MNDQEVRRGAGIYSKPVLVIYDTLVVRLSNSVAWRCPSRLMLERYDQLLGRKHLDVGPGTGWYLAHADSPNDLQLTLMDLNKNSIEHATQRLRAELDGGQLSNVPRGLVGNVLEPIPETAGQFDSIAVNYVFHCVPGTWQEKGVAFEHLAQRLDDDGVLFGATILGDDTSHNILGRGLMDLYNHMGIFHNREDDVDGLCAALESAFEDVTLRVVGKVAVFDARGPRH